MIHNYELKTRSSSTVSIINGNLLELRIDHAILFLLAKETANLKLIQSKINKCLLKPFVSTSLLNLFEQNEAT